MSDKSFTIMLFFGMIVKLCATLDCHRIKLGDNGLNKIEELSKIIFRTFGSQVSPQILLPIVTHYNTKISNKLEYQYDKLE